MKETGLKSRFHFGRFTRSEGAGVHSMNRYDRSSLASFVGKEVLELTCAGVPVGTSNIVSTEFKE